MHEVLHLSFGPQANELNAQFYNTQQTYFVYSKEDLPNSHVDPGVRFVYGKEYTPRAAFWDYRNGFGTRKQFNSVYEEPQSHETIGEEQERPIAAVPRDGANSTTWTGQLKVPLHPSSLHKIPDWEFDSEKFPFGHQRGAPSDELREFDNIEEGMDQFRTVCSANGGKAEDYLDLTFRPLLEKCDLVDGINLVTDLGGWAGFTVPYLEVMRDEYVPKSPVFTWCASRNLLKNRWAVQRSRLEALASFSEFSSLVLPLQDSFPTNSSVDISRNATHHLPLFESVSLLSSLRRNRVSMHQLFMDLTANIPGANIVQAGSDPINEFQGEINRVHNTVEIWRGASDPRSSPSNDEDAYADPSHNHKEYWCPQEVKSSPSATSEFRLEVNDNPLKMRKLIGKGDHELRELVHGITDPYIWGWNDPSDDSDDVF